MAHKSIHEPAARVRCVSADLSGGGSPIMGGFSRAINRRSWTLVQLLTPHWPETIRAGSGMKPVDFIERYLGFSLDRGDGSFEAMLIIVLVTIITGIALAYFRHSLPK